MPPCRHGEERSLERVIERNKSDAAKRRKALSSIKDALFDSCPLRQRWARHNAAPDMLKHLELVMVIEDRIYSTIWSL